MDCDDGVLVIVVGDNINEISDSENIDLKCVKVEENILYDDMLEKVQTYGEHLDHLNIKNEVSFELKREAQSDEDFETLDDSDVDLFSNESQNDQEGPLQQSICDEFERISVKDLKNENPMLKQNRQLLIQTLVDMMKKEKPPQPPENIIIKQNNKYKCSFCNFINDTYNAATRHYQHLHGSFYLSCYGCGKTFRSTHNLYRHERRCGSRDSAVVLKARAIFLGRKGRSRPFLTNTPCLKEINMGQSEKKLNPLKNECYKKTLNKKGKITYVCPKCPAIFSTKQAMLSHDNKHKGLRPFQCDVCRAAYTSEITLSRHKVKHNGPRFICDYCGRTTLTKHNMKLHIDGHFKIKNFACSQCSKRYGQKCQLIRHVNKIHEKLPPSYVCEMCPKRYYRMYLLKEHMLKEHGMLLMTKGMLLRSLSKLPPEESKIRDEIELLSSFTV